MRCAGVALREEFDKRLQHLVRLFRHQGVTAAADHPRAGAANHLPEGSPGLGGSHHVTLAKQEKRRTDDGLRGSLAPSITIACHEVGKKKSGYHALHKALVAAEHPHSWVWITPDLHRRAVAPDVHHLPRLALVIACRIEQLIGDEHGIRRTQQGELRYPFPQLERSLQGNQ